MAYNDARKRATSKYMSENLDTIIFRLPKEKKDQRPTKQEITEHAEKHGYQSTQQFIIQAINNQMLLDKKEAAFINFNECKKED